MHGPAGPGRSPRPPPTGCSKPRNRNSKLPRHTRDVPELATIGVYGFDCDSFLAALRAARVLSLLDVRQRRGVRGPEYAWANSRRLQTALSAAAIAYEHHREP